MGNITTPKRPFLLMEHLLKHVSVGVGDGIIWSMAMGGTVDYLLAGWDGDDLPGSEQVHCPEFWAAVVKGRFCLLKKDNTDDLRNESIAQLVAQAVNARNSETLRYVFSTLISHILESLIMPLSAGFSPSDSF